MFLIEIYKYSHNSLILKEKKRHKYHKPVVKKALMHHKSSYKHKCAAQTLKRKSELDSDDLKK